MIIEIKQSLELAAVIKAQLVCAKRALEKGEHREARKYLEMAQVTAKKINRSLRP